MFDMLKTIAIVIITLFVYHNFFENKQPPIKTKQKNAPLLEQKQNKKSIFESDANIRKKVIMFPEDLGRDLKEDEVRWDSKEGLEMIERMKWMWSKD